MIEKREELSILGKSDSESESDDDELIFSNSKKPKEGKKEQVLKSEWTDAKEKEVRLKVDELTIVILLSSNLV